MSCSNVSVFTWQRHREKGIHYRECAAMWGRRNFGSPTAKYRDKENRTNTYNSCVQCIRVCVVLLYNLCVCWEYELSAKKQNRKQKCAYRTKSESRHRLWARELNTLTALHGCIFHQYYSREKCHRLSNVDTAPEQAIQIARDGHVSECESVCLIIRRNNPGIVYCLHSTFLLFD